MPGVGVQSTAEVALRTMNAANSPPERPVRVKLTVLVVGLGEVTVTPVGSGSAVTAKESDEPVPSEAMLVKLVLEALYQKALP